MKAFMHCSIAELAMKLGSVLIPSYYPKLKILWHSLHPAEMAMQEFTHGYIFSGML